MAADQTKKLIDDTRMSTAKWLFPDDPELTTLQVTLPKEALAEIDAEVIAHGLHDREQFVALAVKYVLRHCRERQLDKYA